MNVKGGGIVSLLPSVTDIIFELKAENQLVGISTYCVVPESSTLPKLGGIMDSNIEEVLRLKPEYVFTYVGGKERLSFLENTGVKIISLKFESLDDIFTNYIIIGKIVNKENLAKEKVEKIKTILKTSKENIQKQSTIIVLYADSLLSGEIYSAGENTYFSEIIGNFGFKNIAPKLGSYPIISKEGFLRLNPDTIFVISPEEKKVNFCQDKAYQSMTACKKSTIFMISGKRILHPGPSVFSFIKQIDKVFKQNAKNN